jgi:hypothetical protein
MHFKHEQNFWSMINNEDNSYKETQLDWTKDRTRPPATKNIYMSILPNHQILDAIRMLGL